MELHEPRFWGLDPVFSSRVKLNIIDVKSLDTHPTFQEMYCILNHPVQSVHIMGDVVSLQRKAQMIKYEIDDGTGVLSCTQWRVERDSDRGLFIPELGRLVSVWGKLSEFRGEKQLTVSAIVEEKDPNAEPLHWLEIAHLKKTVYNKPFSLPAGVIGREEVPLKHAIHQALLTFLNSSLSGRHFTLQALSCDPALVQCCMDAASKGSHKHVEQEVRRELVSAVQDLPEGGAVIPALGTGIHQEQLYEVFSAKKHLCPIILGYIQKKEQTETAERLGVPEAWIIQFVKQKEVFRHLPPLAITAAVEELIDESRIYLHSTKAYKSIK